ncbi:MAG: transposase [Candidatus Eisenbacteria bacterium]
MKTPGRNARKVRKQYSPEKRAAILAEAREQKLTGKQVAAKYHISMVTYYLWKKKSGAPAARGRKAAKGDELDGSLRARVRAAIREEVSALLPSIVQAELDRLLRSS